MLTSIEKETEFSDLQVSEWLLHEIYNNTTYLESLSRINDMSWYADRDVGLLVELVVKYYNRHHTAPTNDAIVGNIRYLGEQGRLSCDTEKLVDRFLRIISTPLNIDSDVIRESIELFIKKSGLFQCVSDYITAKSKTSDSRSRVTFEKTYSDISKYYEFRLDNDIGLDYFNQFDKQLAYLLNPDIRLKLGIDAIDTWSNGGIPSEGNCLCAFQAGTNVGKTLFLGNVAYNLLKQDKCVVVITMEISALGYGRRLSALLSGCNVDCLATYHTEMEENIAKFHEEHPNARLVLKEYPMHGTTTGDIDTYIENLKHEGINPDIIIVDYLNLLTPSFCNKNEQQFIKVAIVSEQLRAISKKYKVPIFTATQSSRGSLMDQETKLQDMAQSLGLAVAADLILGLYCFKEEENVVHMNCIKNRFGSKNYISRMYRIDQNTLEPIDIGDSAVDDATTEINPVISVAKKPQTVNADFVPQTSPNPQPKPKNGDTSFKSVSSIANDEFELF